MKIRPPARILKPAAALAILAATLALGVLVRLEDPLSTRVIPAEDPYTHMALVRSHLNDGSLDALYENGRLYPPGMHAVVAATWVYTGIPLDDIFRFAPVVLGAIGIAGIGLLLWRCHGPVAAIVGSLAIALAPEVVFRTSMMSPTALDMAILPFFLLAVLQTLRGRLAWGTVVAGLSLFFVMAHPWLLAILVPASLGIVGLWFVLGGRGAQSGPLSALGAAAVLASVAGALLLAVSTCWSQCELGGTARGATSGTIDTLATTAAVAALACAVVAVLVRKPFAAWHGRRKAPGWPLRIVVSAMLAVALVAVSIPAFQAGMPEHVKLPRMIGMPIMAIGAIGLLALPFLPSRAAFAGAALAVVTYPFVIYNPFDSPFWPHRTAVYLAVALAILAGIGASAIVGLVRRAVERFPVRRKARTGTSRVALAGIAGLVATTMLAGSVYAQTPLNYETGWYRLYPECEYDGLREIGAEADGDTLIIAGDWRPKLVVAAFTEDADNVWYDSVFFSDPARREHVLLNAAKEDQRVIVIVDRHLKVEHPEANTTFVHAEPWIPMGPWCSGGTPGERLNAYTTGVGA